jgi:hypothetical protein
VVVRPARLQTHATLQRDDELAKQRGLELVDAAHVDDERAMDAEDARRIERQTTFRNSMRSPRPRRTSTVPS